MCNDRYDQLIKKLQGQKPLPRFNPTEVKQVVQLYRRRSMDHLFNSAPIPDTPIMPRGISYEVRPNTSNGLLERVTWHNVHDALFALEHKQHRHGKGFHAHALYSWADVRDPFDYEDRFPLPSNEHIKQACIEFIRLLERHF